MKRLNFISFSIQTLAWLNCVVSVVCAQLEESETAWAACGQSDDERCTEKREKSKRVRLYVCWKMRTRKGASANASLQKLQMMSYELSLNHYTTTTATFFAGERTQNPQGLRSCNLLILQMKIENVFSIPKLGPRLGTLEDVQGEANLLDPRTPKVARFKWSVDLERLKA